MNEFDKKFDDTFIRNISNNPLQSIFDIVNYILENTTENFLKFGHREEKEKEKAYHVILINGVNLIGQIHDKFKIENLEYSCSVTGGVAEYNELRQCIEGFSTTIEKAINLENLIQKNDRYNALWSDEFTYKFSEKDVKTIQNLINELREKISASKLFEDKHKKRLLARLEKLQAEIHKEMSDIDKIWGLVGDAGIALEKFGKDAKPIVDRIKEIATIGWKIQSKAEGLPEDTQNPL
ncbi:MAG: hypothetical protein DSY43_00280, partial [Gammaproteobacteria bacterium]